MKIIKDAIANPTKREGVSLDRLQSGLKYCETIRDRFFSESMFSPSFLNELEELGKGIYLQ